MPVAWFLVLSAMLTAYAVLDGFDLGVGTLLPWICRSESEREEARASIGPVWNGNEVWLLAAGGALFVAFPRLYAVSFSGFYLALMLVLWLLILRGIGYEFRHAEKSPLWTGLWDTVFSVSSLLLTVLFGVAVGNVLRGVPFDSHSQFIGSFTVLLNPFSILAGVLSLVVLCLHGAAYLAVKTSGELQERARKYASACWIASLALVASFTAASFFVRPGFQNNYLHYPILLLLPATLLLAMALIPVSIKKQNDRQLFAMTSLVIITLLGSAAAGLFPHLLPSIGNLQEGLNIYNTSSSASGQAIALILNLAGMSVVIAYTAFIYKIWSGKTQ
jgi:cytochrome bd ubiquinol oxidase subunit II